MIEILFQAITRTNADPVNWRIYAEISQMYDHIKYGTECIY